MDGGILKWLYIRSPGYTHISLLKYTIHLNNVKRAVALVKMTDKTLEYMNRTNICLNILLVRILLPGIRIIKLKKLVSGMSK